MYRAAMEQIIGFRKQGSVLRIDPCIPREWEQFEITYRHAATTYQNAVASPNGVCRGVVQVSLDGTELDPDGLVPLSADGPNIPSG